MCRPALRNYKSDWPVTGLEAAVLNLCHPATTIGDHDRGFRFSPYHLRLLSVAGSAFK